MAYPTDACIVTNSPPLEGHPPPPQSAIAPTVSWWHHPPPQETPPPHTHTKFHPNDPKLGNDAKQGYVQYNKSLKNV